MCWYNFNCFYFCSSLLLLYLDVFQQSGALKETQLVLHVLKGRAVLKPLLLSTLDGTQSGVFVAEVSWTPHVVLATHVETR
jgi:hypothetical protein